MPLKLKIKSQAAGLRNSLEKSSATKTFVNLGIPQISRITVVSALKAEDEGGEPEGGFTGENKTRKSESFARNDFTYIFKKEVPETLPTVSD